MKESTFAKLIEAMGAIISEEDDDREGYVYEGLRMDMAGAARSVYRACLKSSVFTESQIK